MKVVTLDQLKSETHEILYILPKPSDQEITEQTKKYFNIHADQYDDFDFSSSKRLKYTGVINQIIADDLNAMVLPDELNLFSIACGTGRRETEIKALIRQQHKVNITGIDMSEQMAALAQKRGIACSVGSWPQIESTDLPKNRDVILSLYSFGHLSSQKARLLALSQMEQSLSQDGVIYIDVFNLEDKHRWHPKMTEAYNELGLENHGYELGDFFYQRIGGGDRSFFHCFSESELNNLCHTVGLRIKNIWHVGYNQKIGEILEDRFQGAFLAKISKR